MSFTLKAIELNNIRAHEYFLFEPALTGITAISGDNGAGKSTIVDSFAWALYGTRPSGVRNKNLIKEGVDPKQKPVSVKVTMFVGGIEYIIERKLITEAGATECNVWGKTADADEFTQVAGPAVSHVEKFIRQELGMNEKGFLTSVLIQQKQVDQIVSASPRERGEVIEELTGIASITQAISKANENTRSLQKAASVMQTGDIDTAEEKVKAQTAVCEALQHKETQAIRAFNEAKEAYKLAEDELSKETLKVEKRRKLEVDADRLKTQIDFLKEQSLKDIEYIQEYKKKHGTTINVDPNESKAAADAKRREAYELQSKIKNLNEELKNNIEDSNKCDVLMGEFTNSEEASTKLDELKQTLSSKEEELEQLKTRKVTIAAEIKHSKASHDHIDGENHECPVCKSEIEDPEALKGEIELEIADMQKSQKEINSNIKLINEEIDSLRELIKGTSIAYEAINESERLKARAIEIKAELKELDKTKDIMRVELKSLDEAYNNALKVQADKNALDSAKERSLTVNSKIAEHQSALDKTNEELAELGALNDRSYNALVNRLQTDKDRLAKMSVSGQELQGRKTLELERLNDYKKNLQHEKEVLAQYNTIAEQINISSTASSMLAEFKADRIANSIPTLEFFASDFLSKFTGGAFTMLTLDEKFNTFVTTSNDVVRPVAQLSGGELSSAAIALRLGIAMLLNSSEKNVLILDEVLVSMDEDRSRQIMETIGSMTNSQVIFIAHNSDINSVADKTVLVTRK